MNPAILISVFALSSAGCSLVFERAEPGASDPGSDTTQDPDAGTDGQDLGEARNVELGPGESWVFNTTSGSLTSDDASIVIVSSLVDESDSADGVLQIRDVPLDSLTIQPGATLRVTGDHGLAFWVDGPVLLHGVIDVSSDQLSGLRGPGSGSSPCPLPQVVDAPPGNEKSGSGGTGGSFASVGGDGGAGDQGALTGAIDGRSGDLVFAAGCKGGRGAVRDGEAETERAEGGFGGGALRIEAQSIALSDATVLASGAGGEGGKQGLSAGGGGGGSGGMIWLKAGSISLENSTLRANGGGGGEGSGNCLPGLPGEDGRSPVLGDAARGGDTQAAICDDANDDAGGNGGNGSATSGATSGGDAGAGGGGGGGGGGSEGFVILQTPALDKDESTRIEPVEDLLQ